MRGVVFIYGVDCVERAKVVDVHLVPGGDVIAWSVCNHVSSTLIETWAVDTPHRLARALKSTLLHGCRSSPA